MEKQIQKSDRLYIKANMKISKKVYIETLERIIKANRRVH